MASKAKTITTDSSLDIWRKVPPEEKLQLMAEAHSQGVAASLLVLSICGSVAVGLKVLPLFWGAFIAIPFIFQLVSVRCWRALRPQLVLRYLAARSAARRYAFGVHGQDLNAAMMFRGELSVQVVGTDDPRDDQGNKIGWRAVWIALFPDSFVIMSEQKGGARLESSRILDERLETNAVGFEAGDDPRNREVILSFVAKDGFRRIISLRSPFPAALLAFERQIRVFIAQQKLELERTKLAFIESAAPQIAGLLEDDSDFEMQLPSI